MNIKRLHHLRQVVASGSISAAATALGISQPALTKSLRILEAELGVPLVERRARGVVATAFGAAFVKRTAPVDVLLSDALREIAALRSDLPIEGAIGAGPTWLREQLPEVIASALSTNTALRVRVQPGYDQALLQELRAGRLDAVVAELPAPEQTADLDVWPLTTDNFVVACRRDHPLASGFTRPDQLCAFPWVLPPQPSRARARLDAFFVTHGLTPPMPSLETSSTEMVLRVVACSDALCFQVRRTLDAPDAAALTLVDVPVLASTRVSGIVTRRGGWLPPVVDDVLRRLAMVCGNPMPKGYGTAPDCLLADMASPDHP